MGKENNNISDIIEEETKVILNADFRIVAVLVDLNEILLAMFWLTTVGMDKVERQSASDNVGIISVINLMPSIPKILVDIIL